jgi:hypothetical protein
MVIRGLNKVVVFKSNSPAGTSSLGQTDSYSTLLTTRGRLRKQGGIRNLSAGEFALEGNYDLIVRYTDTLYNAIKPDLKVEIDSGTFTIQSWEKMNEERFYLKFVLARG